ncbi:MAG: 3-oxoadipate enol-lactonase [Burkholderiales bacterium]
MTNRNNPANNDATLSRASAKDGTAIAYTVHGKDSGLPRLALVHSLAMTGAFWNRVVARLAGHAEILTIDCRGHGASDKPSTPYSIEVMADDLADVMDHLGWTSATVAGASMGGSVALAFAGRHGNRTSALGLFDTTAWYGADAPEKWAERSAKARQEGMQALVGFQQTRWFSDAFREQNKDVVNDCVSLFLDNDVAAFETTCTMMGSFDLRSTLSSLTMPTAILVGEEDFATPLPMATILHEGIRGSSFGIIPSARHLTPVECPDVIADALLKLISKGN